MAPNMHTPHRGWAAVALERPRKGHKRPLVTAREGMRNG